jgi:hypothetical protein
MKPCVRPLLALLLLALPNGVAIAADYVEKGPLDLKAYLAQGKSPSFIRIDAKGYNIRNTADFSTKDISNVNFKSKGGDLFAVASVKPMYYGAAVQIHVDDELKWVYVPYARKNDFQFCESEACFTAMANSLDYLLKGTGVGVEAAQDCGVSAGPEGLVLPKGAAHPSKEPDFLTAAMEEHPVKKAVLAPRPYTPAPRPAAPVATAFRLKTRPLWENAKGAQGVNWTQMMSTAMDKYGQNLIHQRTLSDAATFCPRFAALDENGKKEFWIHLFNGIGRYESNFKLGSPVFDEVRKENVYRGPISAKNDSMGLFQLSYGTAHYGKGCQMDWRRDRNKDISDPSLTIYDPKIQMECAVTVMNKWVPRDGGVGLFDDRGGARFWSTLRSSNSATSNVIASLRRDTACFK